MKKYGKYIIILLAMIALIVGLKIINNNQDYYLNVSNEVIKLFRSSNYDTKIIKKKDREAVNKYLSTLTHSNQVIDLTEYINKNNDYYTIDKNTKGVYIENGKCYIKYQDLNIANVFDEFNYDGEPYQRVICNNYFTYIYLSYFYPDYEDTKKNPKYDYVFNKEEKMSYGYLFTYRSTYDGTLLKIKFVINNNTIESITSEF